MRTKINIQFDRTGLTALVLAMLFAVTQIAAGFHSLDVSHQSHECVLCSLNTDNDDAPTIRAVEIVVPEWAFIHSDDVYLGALYISSVLGNAPPRAPPVL